MVWAKANRFFVNEYSSRCDTYADLYFGVRDSSLFLASSVYRVSMKSNLIRKIESKEAVIGIIGMGYVGMPLALRFSDAGFKVIGFDIDPTKAEVVASGKSYFAHIPDSRVVSALNKGLKVTPEIVESSKCDALIICVPTPLGKHREPDLSHITSTVESLMNHLRVGQVICLESTSYPGTTDEEIVTRVEGAGFTVGEDIFAVYSPEREDPGNKVFSTQTIPKVVGGTTSHCLDVGEALYDQIIDEVVLVSSTRAAEMTKLLENIHRAVNIGLVNELKMVTDKMGIDIFEVIKAASSKPFGFTPYYPGPGLGGHCIPIDPYYLTWKAREYGVHTRFIELAGEVNTGMPEWVLGKVEDALNSRGRALNGSNVMVLGIAYKKDTNDTRESPGLKIFSLLKAKGASVVYHDPHVPKIPKLRDYDFAAESIELSDVSIGEQHCIVLCTDHSSIDYELLGQSSDLIVDTRGVFPANSRNTVSA